MPIQLPKLAKVEPTQQRQSARIEGQADVSGGAIGRNLDAISKVGSTFVKAKTAYEDAEIDTLGNRAEIEYSKWQNDKLDKLSQNVDDPTEDFGKYETEENEFVDSILVKNPDLNERVKAGLELKIEKFRAKKRDRVLRQRSAQKKTYDNGIFNMAVDSQHKELPELASHVDANAKGDTTVPFQDGLNDIVSTMGRHYMKNGMAVKLDKDAAKYDHIIKEAQIDENGKAVMVETKIAFTDLGSYKVAEQKAKSIDNSVRALLDLDRISDAKALYNKYPKSLDGETKAKLLEKFKDVELDVGSSAKAGEIAQQPIEKQQGKIDSIKDPNMRMKVEAKVSASMQRRQAKINQKNTKFYNEGANRLAELKKQGNMPLNVSDMEADPVMKKIFSNMDDAKKIASLKEIVEAPKVSSESQLSRMRALMFDRDVDGRSMKGMDNATFNTYIQGMDDKDRKKYTKKYEDMNSSTEAEADKIYGIYEKFARRHLVDNKYIKLDFYGKITSSKRDEWVDVQNDIIDIVDRLGTGASRKEINDAMKEYAKKKKEDDLYRGETLKRLKPFGSRAAGAPREGRVREANPLEGKDSGQIMKLRIKYKMKTGKGLPAVNDKGFLDSLRGTN